MKGQKGAEMNARETNRRGTPDEVFTGKDLKLYPGGQLQVRAGGFFRLLRPRPYSMSEPSA